MSQSKYGGKYKQAGVSGNVRTAASQFSTQDSLTMTIPNQDGRGSQSITVMTGTSGIKRLKTRSVLFQMSSRIGVSDKKPLEANFEIPYNAAMNDQTPYPGAVKMASMSNFLGGPDGLATEQMQLANGLAFSNAAGPDDRRRISQMIATVSTAQTRSKIREAHDMNNENINSNQIGLLKGIPTSLLSMQYDCYKIEGRALGEGTTSMKNSNNWYDSNGYEIINQQRSVTVGVPSISVEVESEKQPLRFFFPSITGVYGLNTGDAKYMGETYGDAMLAEEMSADEIQNAPSLDEMLANVKIKKTLDKSFQNQIHIAIPVLRTYSQIAESLPDFQVLREHARKKGMEFPELNEDLYNQYISRVREEATALTTHAQGLSGNATQWDFATKNISNVGFRSCVYLIVPNLVESGFEPVQSGVLQQTVQLSMNMTRSLMWYRKKDFSVQSAMRVAKSGYQRAEDVEDNGQGIVIDENTGKERTSITFPKLNRYARQNMILAMDCDNLKQLIWEKPSIKYALTFFGVLDVDDQTLRQSVAGSWKENYAMTFIDAFKDRKKDIYQQSASDRSFTYSLRKTYFGKGAFDTMSKRMDAYFKECSRVNKFFLSVKAYESTSIKDTEATRNLVNSFTKVSPYSLVVNQVLVMTGMCAMIADTSTGEDRSTLGNNTVIKGLDRRSIGAFTRLFRNSAPTDGNSTISITTLCNGILSIVFDQAFTSGSELLSMVSNDDVDAHGFFMNFKLGDETKQFSGLTAQKQAFIAGVATLYVEYNETLFGLVGMYSSGNFKGISDIQFYTVILMHAKIMQVLFSMADEYISLLVKQGEDVKWLKFQQPGAGYASEEWWRRDVQVGKLFYDAGQDQNLGNLFLSQTVRKMQGQIWSNLPAPRQSLGMSPPSKFFSVFKKSGAGSKDMPIEQPHDIKGYIEFLVNSDESLSTQNDMFISARQAYRPPTSEAVQESLRTARREKAQRDMESGPVERRYSATDRVGTATTYHFKNWLRTTGLGINLPTVTYNLLVGQFYGVNKNLYTFDSRGFPGRTNMKIEEFHSYVLDLFQFIAPAQRQMRSGGDVAVASQEMLQIEEFLLDIREQAARFVLQLRQAQGSGDVWLPRNNEVGAGKIYAKLWQSIVAIINLKLYESEAKIAVGLGSDKDQDMGVAGSSSQKLLQDTFDKLLNFSDIIMYIVGQFRNSVREQAQSSKAMAVIYITNLLTRGEGWSTIKKTRGDTLKEASIERSVFSVGQSNPIWKLTHGKGVPPQANFATDAASSGSSPMKTAMRNTSMFDVVSM